MVARMKDSTDSNLRGRVTAKQPPVLTSDAFIQARKLWHQHCSWCPRCHYPAKPRCELGRGAYGLCLWLSRIPDRRAG